MTGQIKRKFTLFLPKTQMDWAIPAGVLLQFSYRKEAYLCILSNPENEQEPRKYSHRF